MANVTLRNVRKTYAGGFEAIKGIDFDVGDGQFCVLVGPSGCGKSTLLPLSVTTIAALFVIQFIYGWNQYLWPLLITTQDSMQTIVTGIKKMLYTTDELAEWQLAMATAILAMLPPVAVVIFMQRLFVRGLVQTEK